MSEISRQDFRITIIRYDGTAVARRKRGFVPIGTPNSHNSGHQTQMIAHNITAPTRITAAMKRAMEADVPAPGWDGGIRLDLPMPTSVNAIWRRGRWSTYLSKSYLNWMAKADAELARQSAGRNWQKITGPFNVALMMPMKKRFKCDLDNRIKASLDWSKKAGLIEDDNVTNLINIEWGPVPLGVRLWLVPTEVSP